MSNPTIPNCPECGGSTKRQMLRIGGYICDRCKHKWIENPSDESTWTFCVLLERCDATD